MRLSRRAAVAAGCGGALALGIMGVRRVLAETRGSDEVTPITVASRPIPSLLPAEPGRREFGALTFRSGLVLSSEFPGFGGLSGLWRSPDGTRLVAVSDNAQWLTATATSEGGRLAGLADAVMAPILDAAGEPLRRGPAYDVEALAIEGGTAYLASERVHEVRRLAAWGRDGVLSRGAVLPVPPEIKTLPSNAGLEALAVAPAGHPLAGSVVAIAERSRAGDDQPTRGWVLTGTVPFAFDVARRGGFDVTDLAFLPSGDALLLERRYRVLSGVACRVRRLPRDAFRSEALVDGPTIFDVDATAQIDNMEGLAVHRDVVTGETVVTLLSDNNFSPLQRILMLEFSLS